MKTGSIHQVGRAGGAMTMIGAGMSVMLALAFVGVAVWQALRRYAEEQEVDRRRLGGLRGALVGVDKRTILAAMGPPRATTGRGDVLSDDTWYYPVDRTKKVALAIDFLEGVARRTHVLRSPQR